jgi:hypothetical protein
MERKNMEKKVAVRSKPREGTKRLGALVFKSKRAVGSKKVRARVVPASPGSSGSYKTNEDYAEFLKTYDPQESYYSSSDEIDADYDEFLKTYDPQESYPQASSPGEGGGSQITEESSKEVTKSVRAKSTPK